MQIEYKSESTTTQNQAEQLLTIRLHTLVLFLYHCIFIGLCNTLLMPNKYHLRLAYIYTQIIKHKDCNFIHHGMYLTYNNTGMNAKWYRIDQL